MDKDLAKFITKGLKLHSKHYGNNYELDNLLTLFEHNKAEDMDLNTEEKGKLSTAFYRGIVRRTLSKDRKEWDSLKAYLAIPYTLNYVVFGDDFLTDPYQKVIHMDREVLGYRTLKDFKKDTESLTREVSSAIGLNPDKKFTN